MHSVPIPDYESIMLPLLRLADGGEEHSSKEAVEILSQNFRLTEEEKSRLYPTKKASIFYDRTHWALTYLKHAGLLIGTRRGFFKITQRGEKMLKENPSKIDDKFLSRFPEFVEFQGFGKSKPTSNGSNEIESTVEDKTPWELLDESYKIIRDELSDDLLSYLKNCSPSFFERLVVELLVAMGYGGSIKEAGQAIGRTGDEGVDGVIKEDLLGLDRIYIQAKKWDGTVGRPDIHKFVGALQGQRSSKGIFITTGNFSNEAREYVSKIETKIVIVDGKKLTEYMIDNDIVPRAF